MADRDWHTTPAGLILPFGGGPGTPSIVISGDASQLPADLIAFYAGFGETVVAGFIFYGSTNAYNYQVLVVSAIGQPFICFGGRDNAFVIGETYRMQESAGASFLDIGSHGIVTVNFRGGSDLIFQDAGTILVSDASIVSLTDTSAMTLASGSFIQFNAASAAFASFETGTSLFLNSGSAASINATLTRDGNSARFLMDSNQIEVAASFAATTSAVFVDLTGITLNFTVPNGRTAVLMVDASYNALSPGPNLTTYELIPNLDGSTFGNRIAGSHVGASQMTISKRWRTTVTAGNHTVKMQYRRSGGADVPTVQTGSSMTYSLYY